jgi:aldehyde dehydrogenase (NAD+)
MSLTDTDASPLRHADRFFIGGEWVPATSDATIDVIDSGTERLFFSVAEANESDMSRAIAAARQAFDAGPWPRMTHGRRAEYLRSLGAGLAARADAIGQIWPRESGVLHRVAHAAAAAAGGTFDFYAGLADTFEWEREAQPSSPGFGLLVREPVGVVGAIIPWNGPLGLISYKIAPALIAGCTVILKSSPEAPGEGYLVAEVAEEIGLPPGVLNVVTADRPVSETLVRDPRVDKITFTGSTAAGRRIASLCGERIARCTLELGGKSAAVILEDADIGTTAKRLAQAECMLTGQVCSSLTRIVVTQHRHDELVDALVGAFSQVRVGNQFDPDTQMGPLAASRQRDRVLDYVEKGKAEGATLATGGGRPPHLDKGWFVEPTVFAGVDNGSTIAREEIFGPVLSVIPAKDEQDAVAIANDTVYGLNASVFTGDADRAREVAGQLRTGTVGHNSFRTDFSIAFGGFKQSGIGREGGTEGLLPFLETKTVILEERPSAYGPRS